MRMMMNRRYAPIYNGNNAVANIIMRSQMIENDYKDKYNSITENQSIQIGWDRSCEFEIADVHKSCNQQPKKHI